MNTEPLSLAEQREHLRSQLHAQRGRLALRLAPPQLIAREYPRSKTMRFLTRQPAVAARILATLAPKLFGGNFIRTATIALALGKTVAGLLRNR